MNAPLRHQLVDSIALHDDPGAMLGKVLHDLNSAIDYLEVMHTASVSASVVTDDYEAIEDIYNRFGDVLYEIWKARDAQVRS